MKHIILGTCLFLFTIGAAQAGGAWTDSFEAGIWDGNDGKAGGIQDNTRAHSGANSMRCEQTPTETRPHKLAASPASGAPATTGTLTLWVYDDGADIKAFDVRIWDDANLTASLGLRDSLVGSASEYVYGFNNVFADTGIARSVGWHKFEFFVRESGTELRIDEQGWVGNINPANNRIRRVLVFTNFGSASDANQVWVDDAEFIEAATHTAAGEWQHFQ